MRILQRKLRRDLWRLRWQMAAIALLIACGVSVAVMAFSSQKALVIAQRQYYQQTHFGDLFATATRAPRSAADALARIDGVTVVDARAMKIGLMNVPGLLRPATARLIALPDDEQRALNRIVLVNGRRPDPRRLDEAVALKTFLDAAHVRLGDRLTVVIGGRQLTLVIVGAALSPEYVYVPSNGPMPDDAHQGVLWAPRAAVERPTGLGDAFSAVSLAIAPGASTPAALAAIDRVLAPYGGTPAYARADQLSHKFQEDRIERLQVMAFIIPPVFLIVAAALVHLVLGRMVDSEREQIGLLKAFGYDDRQAAVTYLELAVLVGAIGAVAGGVLGGRLGNAIVAAMAAYMRFPHLVTQFSWTAFVIASTVSIAAAATGSLAAVRRAIRLSPAVAMQPSAPASFRRGFVERFTMWRHFDEPTRIIARNIERFPVRAAMTTAGLAVSVSLLVGSQFLFGMFDGAVDQAYYRARRWTDQVNFGDVRDVHAVAEMTHVPAVVRAEPFRNALAHLRANGRDERVALIGSDEDAQLEQTLDASGRPIPLESRGVVLSEALAACLAVHPGDLVELEITQGRHPRVLVPVTAVAQDYAGLIAHISRTALNRILGDGDVVSGANLTVIADRRGEFYRAITRTPELTGTASRDDTVTMFRAAVTSVMQTEMLFFLGFAAAIAFGIAYNVSRIALADRARDLATLRVLGFEPYECAYILSGELVLLALVATPIGAVGGVGLASALLAAFRRQNFFMPLTIAPHAFGIAFATYLGAVLLAAGMAAQRVWRFDLVAVLKTRE